MAGVRSGARQVRRLVGVVFFGAPLVLGAFMACGGGAPGDTDGGAGNGSDAGGADGDSGGSGSGANGSGGGPGGADGSGGTGASIELDEYCERHAELYYDYLQACYGAKDFPESYRAEYVERIE